MPSSGFFRHQVLSLCTDVYVGKHSYTQNENKNLFLKKGDDLGGITEIITVLKVQNLLGITKSWWYKGAITISLIVMMYKFTFPSLGSFSCPMNYTITWLLSWNSHFFAGILPSRKNTTTEGSILKDYEAICIFGKFSSLSLLITLVKARVDLGWYKWWITFSHTLNLKIHTKVDFQEWQEKSWVIKNKKKV